MLTHDSNMWGDFVTTKHPPLIRGQHSFPALTTGECCHCCHNCCLMSVNKCSLAALQVTRRLSILLSLTSYQPSAITYQEFQQHSDNKPCWTRLDLTGHGQLIGLNQSILNKKTKHHRGNLSVIQAIITIITIITWSRYLYAYDGSVRDYQDSL